MAINHNVLNCGHERNRTFVASARMDVAWSTSASGSRPSLDTESCEKQATHLSVFAWDTSRRPRHGAARTSKIVAASCK